jgi:hypothetical protein
MKNSWVWWHVPIISTTAGNLKHKNRGLGWPGQKARPYLQNNQNKKLEVWLKW